MTRRPILTPTAWVWIWLVTGAGVWTLAFWAWCAGRVRLAAVLAVVAIGGLDQARRLVRRMG